MPDISRSVVILHEMSADEEMREIARLREKAELDELSAQNYYTEKGRTEGIAEGIVKGRAEGRTEGATEEHKKIVAKLLKKGLSEEEIRNLLD